MTPSATRLEMRWQLAKETTFPGIQTSWQAVSPWHEVKMSRRQKKLDTIKNLVFSLDTEFSEYPIADGSFRWRVGTRLPRWSRGREASRRLHVMS